MSGIWQFWLSADLGGEAAYLPHSVSISFTDGPYQPLVTTRPRRSAARQTGLSPRAQNQAVFELTKQTLPPLVFCASLTQHRFAVAACLMRPCNSRRQCRHSAWPHNFQSKLCLRRTVLEPSEPRLSRAKTSNARLRNFVLQKRWIPCCVAEQVTEPTIRTDKRSIDQPSHVIRLQ